MSQNNAFAPGLIYVAGYGRSGSTLLDTLLGSQENVFGGGELMWLFHEAARQDSVCSCGQFIKSCSFWREVLERVARKLGHRDWGRAAKLSQATERIGRLRGLDPDYLAQWKAAFQAIRVVSGKSWIVDSSKNNRRGYHRLGLLGENMPDRFRVLHLVRDPRAVMWSVSRGSNRRIEAGSARPRLLGGMARGLFSWMFSNVSVERVLGKHPSWPVMRIRYEDIVAYPHQSLAALGDFLGLDMSGVAQGIDGECAFWAGHGIGGNRMRRGGKIVLRFDREWESKLPRSAHLSSLMAWPLMRKYKYRAADRSSRP